jgi:hypothetical protein
MTDQRTITPPAELVQEWVDLLTQGFITAFTTSAQWGADQELEAYCKLLELSDGNARDFLQSARRPKPPSLKELALQAHERCAFAKPGDRDIVRLALETLSDD